MKRKLIVLLITIIIGLYSCGQKKHEDFGPFYVRFNTDSVFQHTRVNIQSDSIEDYSIGDIDTTVFQLISSQKENEVIKKIINRSDTTYYIQFTFVRKAGNWYLIDYKDSYYD